MLKPVPPPLEEGKLLLVKIDETIQMEEASACGCACVCVCRWRLCACVCVAIRTYILCGSLFDFVHATDDKAVQNKAPTDPLTPRATPSSCTTCLWIRLCRTNCISNIALVLSPIASTLRVSPSWKLATATSYWLKRSSGNRCTQHTHTHTRARTHRK